MKINGKSIRIKSFACVFFGLLMTTLHASTLFSKKPEFAIATVLTEEETTSSFRPLYVKNDFEHFKEALAFKESQGNYKAINKLGYLGKYQFGRSTLERFEIYNIRTFLKTPELQEEAFLALCSVNKWILRKDIRRSKGKTINGIFITESGILAAAHLGGAGNVKKFLRSLGTMKFKDAFGTSIESYLRLFAGYDTSAIKANRMATVASLP
ncbi:MAG: peptidoglycan-binding protein LysM [Flavicella sp.]|nr:peptidoglycan-binding protein LysM [Flavicella sp.]